MRSQRLPRTDSIQKLARFWETHDLSDFENQLEEVAEPVFQKCTVIPLNLESAEAKALRKMARNQGIAEAELVHRWVREKICAR